MLPKLQSDLKTPFVLNGIQRVDDTPIHKVLREAVVNTLSNADYNGRRGVVITKDNEGFTFANPGGMRIPVNEAIEGGVSDPRNSTILKFFSLIKFGERAGSGLNGIMHIWKSVYHTDANISELPGDVERTVLTLPFNGNEQDVDAMLKLYDNLEVSKKSSEDIPDKDILSNKITDKFHLSDTITDKLPITENFISKITDIYTYIWQHPHSSTEDIAVFTGRSRESAKKYIQALVAIMMITPEGGKKNRTYSVCQ